MVLETFRKTQKTAFVVLAVVLLLLWLSPLGSGMGRQQGDNSRLEGIPVAKAFGRDILQGEVFAAQKHRQILMRFVDAVRNELGGDFAALDGESAQILMGNGGGDGEAQYDIILNRRADRDAIEVTDQDAIEYIAKLTKKKLDSAGLKRAIARRPAGEGTRASASPYTERELIDAIRFILKADRAERAVMYTLNFETPFDSWSNWEPKQSRADLQFVKLPVEKFVDAATKPDDEKALRDLYDKAKERFIDPEGKRFGLRVPEKLKIEYLVAKVDAFSAGINVTDEEAKKYYEENQSEFLDVELPVPAGSPDVPPVPKRDLPAGKPADPVPPKPTDTPKSEPAKPADPKPADPDKPADSKAMPKEAPKAAPEAPKADPKANVKPAEPKAPVKPAESKPAEKKVGLNGASAPTLVSAVSSLMTLSESVLVQDQKKADPPVAPKADAGKAAATDVKAAPKAPAAPEAGKSAPPAEAKKMIPDLPSPKSPDDPVKPAAPGEAKPLPPLEPLTSKRPDGTTAAPGSPTDAPAAAPAPPAEPPKPRYKPFDKVKADIIKNLKRDRARKLANDKHQQLMKDVFYAYADKYDRELAKYKLERVKEFEKLGPQKAREAEMDLSGFKPPAPPDLAVIAKEQGLELRSTNVVTVDEARKLAGIGAALRVGAFDEAPMYLVGQENFRASVFQDRPEPRDINEYYIAWRTVKEASKVEEYEASREKLVQRWRLEQAGKKAQEAAEKLLADAKAAGGDLVKAIPKDSGYTSDTTGLFSKAAQTFGMDPFNSGAATPLQDLPKIGRVGPEEVLKVFKLRKDEFAVVADEEGNNRYVVKVLSRIDPEFKGFMNHFRVMGGPTAMLFQRQQSMMQMIQAGRQTLMSEAKYQPLGRREEGDDGN
jgi:hypothetical protein